MSSEITRRSFMASSAAALAGTTIAFPSIARGAHAFGSDTLKVGVIGCGGRGTGAAVNALEASPNTKITGLCDVFPGKIEQARGNLQEHGERIDVPDDRCFGGFDGYKKLLASGIDYVVIATPPHFRPMHFAEAVARGVNVFMEKPVGVDPAGIRRVLAAADDAERKGLSVVAGTQRRHQKNYQDAVAKIKEGGLGTLVSGRVYWNQGGLWSVERTPEMSDMEWQLKNWLYFTWLSGDHICEQHVHNLDVANWVMGGHPIRCMGMGGRQSRTQPVYGHIFDHFAIEYEYADGKRVQSFCRQVDGCASRVEEQFSGSDGTAVLRGGSSVARGKNPWQFTGEDNPYVTEHADLVGSIMGGKKWNQAREVAESTLTAIMGRMSAYTGQEVTWEQALNSKLDLSPPSYAFGPVPPAEVAVPGRTPLV